VALCLVQDFAKERPEDDMLDLGEIPGLVPSAKASFSYIRDEVATHLAEETLATREEVLLCLGVFESTVFETRVMPRAPPHRALDLDVTLHAGTEPITRRPYPVAAHRQTELQRQTDVLLDAGIIRHSVSPFAALSRSGNANTNVNFKWCCATALSRSGSSASSAPCAVVSANRSCCLFFGRRDGPQPSHRPISNLFAG